MISIREIIQSKTMIQNPFKKTVVHNSEKYI